MYDGLPVTNIRIIPRPLQFPDMQLTSAVSLVACTRQGCLADRTVHTYNEQILMAFLHQLRLLEHIVFDLDMASNASPRIANKALKIKVLIQLIRFMYLLQAEHIYSSCSPMARSHVAAMGCKTV